MAEKHRVFPHNPREMYMHVENDFDTSNTPAKPIEIPQETKPDTARPANTGFPYESPAVPAPARSPTLSGHESRSPTTTKRPAEKVEHLPFRQKQKRPRHEECATGSQAESTDAPKASTSLESRPAQPMTRAASAHKAVQSKQRPRAQSLPARLGPRSEWNGSHHYQDRQLQHMPPVNLKTLRELELSEFYRNPKLRHDVVFDAQLHFRPNNDGSRGLRKKVDSQGYWQMVLVECEILLNIANRKGTMRPQERPMKIPILLATMRDILLTLVPRADREEVESSLDPDLLMQQLEHGILDLKRMSVWLARIFKAHCAPMRDQWVDQMVSQFERGVDKGDTRSLMEGWKSIFGILEAMKLDVANHQIRTLRPHLISTAVVFEQSYFQSRIEQGRLETQEPKHWYQQFFAEYKARTGSEDHVDCFMRATLDMITPSKKGRYQSTFTFDIERLDCLRDDIREATCLRVCTLLYRQLAIGVKREIEDKDIGKIVETISAVLGDEGGSEKFVTRSADVALSIAHIACGGAFPSAAIVKMAENWLAKHLEMSSPIYKATELSFMKDVAVAIEQTVKGWSSPAAFPIAQVADNTLNLVTIKSIAQRLSNIAFLHWQVFGKLVYLAEGTHPTSEQKFGDYGIHLAAAIGNKEIIWSGDKFTSS